MSRTSTAVDTSLIILAATAVGFSALRYFRPPAVPAPSGTAGLPQMVAGLEEDLRGAQLPPLQARTSDNPDLHSFDLRGSVTVLMFFRSTCPACEQAAPRWADMVGSLPDRVRAVAVNQESLDVARNWAERFGLAIDETILPTTLEPWGIQAVPTTLVVDRSGVTVSAHIGPMTPDEVEALHRLVRDLSVTQSRTTKTGGVP